MVVICGRCVVGFTCLGVQFGAFIEGLRAEFVVELLLEVFKVVYLEEFVEFDALDEVAMPNSSHDRHDVDREAAVADLEVVSDERVVLVANCKHLLVGADVKAERLAVVIR